jgi:hypothetical protein
MPFNGVADRRSVWVFGALIEIQEDRFVTGSRG